MQPDTKQGGSWTRRAFLGGVCVTAVAAGWRPLDLLAARIVLCPRCGREAAPGQAQCGHCGADIPSPEPAMDPEPDPESETDPGPFEGTHPLAVAARWDQDRARRASEADDPALALLFARNALALIVAGEAHGIALRADLLEWARRNLDEFSLVRRTCPLCRGTGHRVTLVTGLDRQPREMDLPDSPCPLCRGQRERTALRPAAEVRHTMARAVLAHRETRLAVGHLALREAWIPAALEPSITLAERATLQSTAAHYCTDCYGLGSFGCPACEGLGLTVCPNSACVMGVQRCPACAGSGRERQAAGRAPALRSCSECAGRGMSDCPECEGRGWRECARCQGSRSEPCRRCEGAGLRAACRRCDGRALDTCRRCRGLGEMRGQPCVTCQGETMVLCPTCGGDGHARR